jgi:Zn-dependent M28 family amino/carboxypeptidase
MKDEIEGNIVIVTSRTPQGMARPLHRTEKLNRSILSGASGFIFMNHYPAFGPPTGSVSTIIPSVGVSYEDGKTLLRTLKKFSRIKVKISISCENRDVRTWNVLADLKGTTDDELYVVVGAHYEGHDISVGAIDSGSGACIVLELARVLSKVKEHLKRRIRFICFSAEEIGLWGSKDYVEKHQNELSNLMFMFNLDAAGNKGEKGVQIHSWPGLEPFFKEIVEETKAVMPIYQRASPYSDHWPFLIKGIPTASMGDPEAFSRRGGRGFGHTRYDTVDKIDIRNLWEAVSNGARILLRIANTDYWPIKHREESAVQKIIKEQGYNETINLTKKIVEYLSDKNLTPEVKSYLAQIKENLSLSNYEFQI